MVVKKFICVSLSTLLMSSAALSVNADSDFLLQDNSDESITEKVTYSYATLSNIEEVIDGGSIIVNGEENKLYRTFENQEAAIEDIKAKIPTLLNVLAIQFDLDELSDNNWKEYQDSMYMLFDSDNKPKDYNESNQEFRTLRAFFDIYENAEKNEQIIVFNEALQKTRGNNSELMEELALLLPYTEPLVQDYMDNIIQPRVAIDVDTAVNYAEDYATSPNTPKYYYFSHGDCTNFVSQILESTGVSQVVYDSEYSGWWHKRTSNLFGYKHTHSRSWTMADVFARYMGVKYNTTSNYNFSKNINKGNFVAADFDDDGDWDHMGFVTNSDSYVGSSYGYYDYKIAQHTSNYNAWASGSTNSWETVGTDGGRYGRVRD